MIKEPEIRKWCIGKFNELKTNIRDSEDKNRYIFKSELKEHISKEIDSEKKILTLELSFKNMDKKLDEISNNLKNLPEEFKNIFGTKEEHNNNKLEISKIRSSVQFHSKIIYGFIWLIATLLTYMITKNF